ncbi:uncharacterized protein LOC132560819 [Ylistrum balloti]|uniref:uncharacterized protein LOC132560819 n=1 Tax=Ylistrum balloti TaxID=509963 RepID=UPI0029059E85|nr:uncharacterized protein LOC132560819 [Ylistrum balloti]
MGLLWHFIYTEQNKRQSFAEDMHNISSEYSIRYPVRKCDTNMTYIDFSDSLTANETARVDTCIATYEQGLLRGKELERSQRSLRWESHSYLNNRSFVIEAGGFKGLDAKKFNARYHPGTYVVLEPVKEFYDVLVKKFRTSPNMLIYNFGIDATDGVFYVNGARSQGSSIFFKNQNNSSNNKAAKIVNVKSFFEKMSVRSRDVDLITLNCEGCEYAVLDLLLSTDYIRHFRNIQFQSHRISRICFPIKRFCWYQELLQRTHYLTFQFKFLWENWHQIKS